MSGFPITFKSARDSKIPLNLLSFALLGSILTGGWIFSEFETNQHPIGSPHWSEYADQVDILNYYGFLCENHHGIAPDSVSFEPCIQEQRSNSIESQGP